jgi:hypothetical protein
MLRSGPTARLRARTLCHRNRNREAAQWRRADPQGRLLRRAPIRRLAALLRRVPLQAAEVRAAVADRMAEETAAAMRVVHHTGPANRIRNLSLSLSLLSFSRLAFFLAAINACFPLQLLPPGRVIFRRDINLIR